MFKEFIIKTDTAKLLGYDFEIENPDYVMAVIHGIGEHMGRYSRMADYLKEKNIAVTGMDLRGHGASVGKRGDCQPRQSVLNDIDALITYTEDKYKNIPLILYGHSMGGNIVLDYRSRGKLNDIPEAYIVSAPWIELAAEYPDALVKTLRILASHKPDFCISSNIDERKLGNPEYVGSYKKNPLVHSRISLRTVLDGFDIGKALADGTLETNGKAAGKKMLLMHGKEDSICSISGTEKVFNHEDKSCTTFIAWDGLRHEIHNGGDNSDGSEVLKAIADFILGLSPSAAE